MVSHAWTLETMSRTTREPKSARLTASEARTSASAGTPEDSARVVHDPEICGGAPTLAGTRIGVHQIVRLAARAGGDAARVLDDYPHLTLEQVAAALAYYDGHRDEVDAASAARSEFYDRLVRS